MAAALEAIRSGAATYAQASATWGIPQGTLKARIKRERAAQAKAPDPQRACNQGATAAQPTVIDLGTLHADPSNARIHDQRNKAAIAASIDRHGFLGAVVVEKGTGRILAGNERTQQALAAGMTEGVVVKYDPQRQVPVIMADLDGAEADRFALTDNRTAELADWDEDVLKTALAAIGEEGREALTVEKLWTRAELKSLLTTSERAAPDVISSAYNGTFAILVTCDDERHQRELLERMTDEGLNVRAWSL